MFFENTVLAKLNIESPSEAALPVQTSETVQNKPIAEYKSINYDRPASSKDLAVGGETVTSLKPFPAESQAEINQMDSQLRVIATTSNPAFLPTMFFEI